MGLTLGPVYDKKFADDDVFMKFTDGKLITSALDILDEASTETAVTKFSDFAPDFEALAEDLGPGETLDDTWFEISDGLRTLAALVQALSKKKQWPKSWSKADAKDLIECLQELEKDLQRAKKHTTRFYFLVC